MSALAAHAWPSGADPHTPIGTPSRTVRGRFTWNYARSCQLGLSALLGVLSFGCVNDTPMAPRRGAGTGVEFALRASVLGLAAEGSDTVRVEVLYRAAGGQEISLPVNPGQFGFDPHAAPTPQTFTVDLSQCPTAGSTGCALSLRVTLSDSSGDLATSGVGLGLVRAGDRLSPASIELVPRYPLTIVGGGEGTGSGTVSVPAVGDQPALDCQVTNGAAASSGCAARYPLHTTLTLTANDSLLSWGGNCAAAAPAGPCELAMDGARTAGASFAVPPTTGALVVTVGGLPAGALPQVTVSNTRGFSHSVAATDTLTGLDPGTDYTVSASPVPVPAEGRTYTPTPASQQVEITAGGAATVQVGYNPPGSGSLAISITGLPENLAAAVTVTGPAGLDTTLTATQVLAGLVPESTYTVTAATVDGEDQPFGPYLPDRVIQPITVQSGQTLPVAVGYDPSRAELTVAVSGLAGATDASVKVSGPQGFSVTVTRSTTLSRLFPGTYTVTAGLVPTPGRTYAPTPIAHPLELSAGHDSLLTIGYSALRAATLRKGKGEGATCLVNTFCDDMFEVTAFDSAGNPVQGDTVVWTAGEPSGECTDNGHPVVTDVGGVSRASNACKYPNPGTYHQTAALLLNGVVVEGSVIPFTFTLTTAPISAQRSRVELSRATLRTCCDTSTVTVTALDASGAPVRDATVALFSTGSAVELIQPAGPTNEQGVATGRVRAKANGVKTISAAVNGVRLQSTGTVTVSAGLLFTTTDGRDRLAVASPDGSAPSEVLSDPNLRVEQAAWSPDGSRIAFAATRCAPGEGCTEDPDIWIMEADGSNPVDLTDQSPFFDEANPAWSPDGASLAFDATECSTDLCNREIYVMPTSGSIPVNLTQDNQADDFDPSWSPDGLRIVFASRPPEEQCGEERCQSPAHLSLVDARGGTPTSLTNSSHDTSDPAWSPDGSRIAFTDNDFGDILVAPSGGGEPVNLTADLRRSEESFAQPAWSPDGSRIAMSVFGGIFTMASNGTDLQQVNPAGTGGSQPSWR